MSSTASRVKTALLVCGLLAGAVAASAAEPKAVDPLFGLKYDTAAVHFEAADTKLTTTCAELTNAKWDRKLFVYASAQGDGAKYLVLGGFYVPRAKAAGAVQADRVGAIVEIKDGACKLVGPPQETFAAPEDVSKAALSALANDAGCRYARAFGSRAAFIAALKRQGIRVTEKESPVLSKATSSSLSCR